MSRSVVRLFAPLRDRARRKKQQQTKGTYDPHHPDPL
jgi:hypothetical protein